MTCEIPNGRPAKAARKWHSSIAIGALTLMFVQGPTESSAQDAVQQTKVVVGVGKDHTGLNPIEFTAGPSNPGLSGIAEGLLRRGEPHLADGTIYPGIAKEIVSEDDTNWTIHLRDDVKFHNGELVTAEDVAFSLLLQGSEEMRETTGYSYFGDIAEAVAVDDTTVSVRLNNPNSLFPSFSVVAYVLPKKYYEEVGRDGFNKQPIFAGPYRYVEWTPDVRLVIEAFPDFYLGKPQIDVVEFRPIPSDAARSAALRAKEVDLISPLAIEQVEIVKSDPDLKVLSKASVDRMLIRFDTKHPIWSKREVRLAANHAIDKDAIVTSVMDGFATVIPALLTPVEAGFNSELQPYAYDPELAKKYMTDAGYPDGLEEEVELSCRDGYQAKTQEVCTILAAMLTEVGIKARPRLYEDNEFRTAALNHAFPDGLFFTGTSGGGTFIGSRAPNSIYACSPEYEGGTTTTPLRPSADWKGYYCNAAMDEKVYEANQLWGRDFAAAEAAVREAERLHYEDAASVYLWAIDSAFGVRKNLAWEPPGRVDFDFFGAHWE